MTTRIVNVLFPEFIENFLDGDNGRGKKYIKYAEEVDEDYGGRINIEYKYEDDPHPCMCRMLWRVDDSCKWACMRYNGSSPFAMWWCSQDEDEEQDEDEDEEQDEDEEDEWMAVYQQTNDFSSYCGDHEHLQPYKNFRYFQCWGGGGEGGFIMNDKDETYKVKRGWYEPFTVEPVEGKIDIMERDGFTQLRIVK